MDKIIIFCAGAVASLASETFWKGKSQWTTVIRGGIGILLLRRILLRFPFKSKALLCIWGAVLLAALHAGILILQSIFNHTEKDGPYRLAWDPPSFSYGLYRFLLLAPAYTIIEYLEARFGM